MNDVNILKQWCENSYPKKRYRSLYTVVMERVKCSCVQSVTNVVNNFFKSEPNPWVYVTGLQKQFFSKNMSINVSGDSLVVCLLQSQTVSFEIDLNVLSGAPGYKRGGCTTPSAVANWVCSRIIKGRVLRDSFDSIIKEYADTLRTQYPYSKVTELDTVVRNNVLDGVAQYYPEYKDAFRFEDGVFKVKGIYSVDIAIPECTSKPMFKELPRVLFYDEERFSLYADSKVRAYLKTILPILDRVVEFSVTVTAEKYTLKLKNGKSTKKLKVKFEDMLGDILQKMCVILKATENIDETVLAVKGLSVCRGKNRIVLGGTISNIFDPIFQMNSEWVSISENEVICQDYFTKMCSLCLDADAMLFLQNVSSKYGDALRINENHRDYDLLDGQINYKMVLYPSKCVEEVYTYTPYSVDTLAWTKELGNCLQSIMSIYENREVLRRDALSILLRKYVTTPVCRDILLCVNQMGGYSVNALGKVFSGLSYKGEYWGPQEFIGKYAGKYKADEIVEIGHSLVFAGLFTVEEKTYKRDISYEVFTPTGITDLACDILEEQYASLNYQDILKMIKDGTAGEFEYDYFLSHLPKEMTLPDYMSFIKYLRSEFVCVGALSRKKSVLYNAPEPVKNMVYDLLYGTEHKLTKKMSDALHNLLGDAQK